ncbi:UTP--glucose-1-phosphate uridylyltransferase [Amylibacter kogurei]|uniref:UTP--glucose-1-phosphate uridylyltransferase n=1 Tax=Paramylibacter kogurei TaxID=1889778 RepID=A0A2G5K147_9RHOB|nr:UTP--glucose-1-phosphate uridylyltransferase [Amylibacter kogurei]PIB23155.1 UTP--glucose-1-phosphate uridylyltransferase [Amylibacter kogurei]
MKPKITKAVFPVAGLGTRFLPATKSIPKEMLPLVDRPLVQYAVDEAREAGIESFLFVSARGKSAMADYFDKHPTLEDRLAADGKEKLLKKLQASNIENGSTAYLRQGEPLGLGHAVGIARNFVDDDEFFAVLLPDDVVAAKPGCLKQMVDAWEETHANIVGTMEVPLESVGSYGILDVEQDHGRLVKASGLVEKPSPEVTPSRNAVIGRYLLSPNVMKRLMETRPGVAGEIQLTDAINAEAAAGNGVYGYRFEGDRFDCGSMSGFLQATISFGLERPELRDDLEKFLRTTIGNIDATKKVKA